MFRIKIKYNNTYVTNVFDLDGSLVLSSNVKNAFYWDTKEKAQYWFNTLGGNDNQVDYEPIEDSEKIEETR